MSLEFLEGKGEITRTRRKIARHRKDSGGENHNSTLGAFFVLQIFSERKEREKKREIHFIEMLLMVGDKLIDCGAII